MALYAILTDDGLSVKEIRDFVDVPTFKPGRAFPAVYGPKPTFDPDLSDLVPVNNMPVNGVVTITYTVIDLPAETKVSKARLRKLRDLYQQADPLEAKRAAGTAVASELRDLGVIGWQIADLMRKQFIGMLR